ncbi:hypothetical protein GIW70_11425 [Pseudomonas syringae]|nr:hypothetical protein [Pseudomonas syringae]MCF5068793.1 hypothetical protein [Pseudomonas syringae]
MKRFLLLGLCVTASMMASTSFADSKPADLCEASIQRINNAKTQYQTSPDLNARVSASVQKAQDLKNRGMIDECVAQTQQTLLDIQNSTADTKK